MSHGQNVLAAIENVRLNTDTVMLKHKKKSGGVSPSRRKPTKASSKKKTAYQEELHKNARVWHKDESADSAGEWLQYTFVGKSESGCRLRDSDTKQEIVVPRCTVHACNPGWLEGTANLTNLTYLNEPSVLHNIRLRYERDEIYTRAGNVLIAVNPFKQLPIYSEEAARQYDGSGVVDQAPHIFEVASIAERAVFETSESQSVVISGESGSGKTENTKFVLRQLTQKSAEKGVDKAILQTNPILEAFGNAKTLRNNNSSRFGKLINIYFSSSTQICGANIYTYLLEKSRVVNVQDEERSYHIFYQLCKGCTEEERQKYRIGEVEDYQYLNQSQCFEIAGANDARDFADVREAFDTFGFEKATQQKVFSLLSGILHLGNLQFSEEDTEGGLQARVDDRETLSTVARLLDIDEAFLERVLTSRVIRARNEQLVKAMDAAQATYARDALAKYIYSALFEWLVKSMNAFIGKKKVAERSYKDINLLDIYGFECFKVNSFEQLCINYANERLQQLFNKHLIELEQKEYEKENLVWKHIPYSSNDDCLDLLQSQRGGIISIIADEINIPQASDRTLAMKLKDQLGGHESFMDNAREPMRFSIAHYPGEVEYDCTNFLDRNRDTLSADLLDLVSSSKDSLLWTLTESCDSVRDQYKQKKPGRRQSTIRQHAVAATFKGQLNSLIDSLSKTRVHYVRCIKPNSEQISNSFNSDLVLHQLKCCGVFEVVQMARAGYPSKYKYEEFSSRYNFLLGFGESGPGGADSKEACKAILKQFKIEESQYQFGSTRLFLRAGALGKVEELQKLLIRSTISIQASFRSFIARRNYVEYRSKVIKTQACARGWFAKRAFVVLLLESRAALKIQVRMRAYLAKKEYAALIEMRKAAKIKEEEEAKQKEEYAALMERRRAAKVKEEEELAKQKEELKLERKVSRKAESSKPEPPAPARVEAASQSVANQDQSQALLEMEIQVERLREGNRNLRVALDQERELKLDFSEQLIVTEASYCQEFKTMKETIRKIRESMMQQGDEAHGFMDENQFGQNGNIAIPKSVDEVSLAFNRKTCVFDDDADFIEEVLNGQTVVENMDPVYELKNLKLRFEDWKDGFKKKLAYLGDRLNAKPKKGLSKLFRRK